MITIHQNIVDKAASMGYTLRPDMLAYMKEGDTQVLLAFMGELIRNHEQRIKAIEIKVGL